MLAFKIFVNGEHVVTAGQADWSILAMHIAGLPEPILYADSWSAWITDPERPIGTA